MVKRHKVSLISALLFVLLACGLVWGTGHSHAGEIMELTGQYVGSEVGDYTYAIVRANGQEHSLFCDFLILQALDCMRPTVDVTFIYSGEMQYIPEAGGEMWVEQVMSVFIPDEYAPDFGLWLQVNER